MALPGDKFEDIDSQYMPSSERVGTDSDKYSISNATSFESFYNMKERSD